MKQILSYLTLAVFVFMVSCAKEYETIIKQPDVIIDHNITMVLNMIDSQESNNTNKCNIYGFVVDSVNNNPIPLANVKLLPTTQFQQTTTDGAYRFDDLDSGYYTLTIEHEMFTPKRYDIKIEQGDNIKIKDIKLQYY